MSDTTRFQESRTAAQMAAALRQAHATRRLERPDPDEAVAALRALGDLEQIPAVAKPGPAALPVKAARAVLRVLLRPWSAVQTRTNHEVARHLAELNLSTHDIARRVPLVEESLVHLERRLRSLEGRTSNEAVPGERTAMDLGRLECAFAQMQIGPQPGRVLVLGASPSLAADLAAFDFDVSWIAPASPAVPQVPGVKVLDPEEVPASGFDVAVRLPGEPTGGGVATTALRTGGLLIAAWRPAERQPWSAGALVPMRVEIVLRVDRGAGSWQVREASSDPRDWEGAGSILLRARRLDATGG